MRNGFLGCVAVLCAGTSFAAAEPSETPSAPNSPPPAWASVLSPASALDAPFEAHPCEAADKGAPCCDVDGNRLWAHAEYLLWWIKDSKTPPLATAGSSADPAPGALLQPGTRVLFGGNIDNDVRSGGRFDTGYWLTDDHALGLDADFLFLDKQAVGFSAAFPGAPVLAVPFRDARTGRETSTVLAFPGLQAGAVNDSLTSRLWGAEINGRSEILRGDGYQLSLLTGFRHVELIETLNTAGATTFTLPNPVLGGINVRSSDRFGTGDFFYGGQIGADGSITSGKFSLSALGKIAFGSMHEVVDINGSTTSTTLTGVTSTVRSGLFARPSNIGRYSRDEFAVVPEAGLKLGYALTSHIHATLGYSFLYESNVLRPGDQIDRTINVTQVPPPLGTGNLVGPARPAFAFQNSDFWAQGVDFGLEFRY